VWAMPSFAGCAGDAVEREVPHAHGGVTQSDVYCKLWERAVPEMMVKS
jgi:hypothetical protein